MRIYIIKTIFSAALVSRKGRHYIFQRIETVQRKDISAILWPTRNLGGGRAGPRETGSSRRAIG